MLADILGYYSKSPTQIGTLKVDIVKTVEYSYEQEVTSHPVEKGYEIHDTIVNKPLRLHLSVAVSSMPVTWVWTNGAGNTKFQDGYTALMAIRDVKQPITIIRPDRLINDLVMTSCKLGNTSDSLSVMNVELEFVQIKKVETKTVEIPQNIVDASKINSAGETAANGGGASQNEVDPNSKEGKGANEVQSKSWVQTVVDGIFGSKEQAGAVKQ